MSIRRFQYQVMARPVLPLPPVPQRLDWGCHAVDPPRRLRWQYQVMVQPPIAATLNVIVDDFGNVIRDDIGTDITSS